MKKTTKEFKKEVYNLVKDEYMILGKYVNNKTKIKIKHNICNNIYEVTPNMFLKGRRCPFCYGTPKKTTEQFKKEIYDLLGSDYKVLGEYKDTNTKIEISHVLCGNSYFVRPYKILHQNHRCPYCSKHKKIILNEFKDKLSDDYTLCTNNIENSHSDIILLHKKCNKKFKTSVTNYNNGRRCPFCYGKKKKTTEQFKKEIYNLVKDEYIILDDYINNSSKIRFKHNKCDKIFYMRPINFIRGNRCPYCNLHKNQSINEKLIEEYLIKNNIRYNKEDKYDDLKDKRNLRLDFYLPDYNLVIETDGSQHEIAGWYKDVNKLKITQKHDKIKEEWCKKHNIDILRISYKIKDHVKYLDNYLKENYELVDE